ncbi:MAG TPA: M20 family metallopeptidase [Tessaracoccus flavescens]|uniref:M20 family metallopeptidase n=1 Tax=Tessaracoccus flavescens TaxID=399497 RepID=A0A921ENH7_9ACTN|nr:M20 family metallopeptidase [Tessaracoccus flavescens]
MSADLLNALVAGIDAVLPQAAALRREIHADPHLSGQEAPTRDRFLAATPWLDWHPVAQTGAWGRIGPGGPAVGVRAELDALPINESTGVEWESRNPGVMHACGHDVHLAALWALATAARGLDLQVGLVPVLQPREEITPPGAVDVVESGLLEDEEIEAMIGVHVQPSVERGVVSTGAGAVNAAYDSFEIVVKGRPGHGAYPHIAVDPIGTLASIVSAICALPSHLVDPTHPTVVSVGQISGGTAPNVIAEEAACRGTIRTFSEGDRDLIHETIARTAEAIALSRGAAAATRFVRGGPALVNDPGLARRVDPLLSSMGLTVAETPFRSCGSDDFAEYGLATASIMCFVGTGRTDGIGLHHGAFLPGRETLRIVAQTMAAGYVAAAGALGS